MSIQKEMLMKIMAAVPHDDNGQGDTVFTVPLSDVWDFLIAMQDLGYGSAIDTFAVGNEFAPSVQITYDLRVPT